MRYVSQNPSILVWDVASYRSFRDRRLERIFDIASHAVNVEIFIRNGEGAALQATEQEHIASVDG